MEELEALIEGHAPQGRKPAAKAKTTQKPKVAEEVPVVQAKESEGSFYKSFGNGMSIRGDGKYFYIKAKDTIITVDASGHVQIEAADNILMKSKRSITLQADENINLISGEGVVQTKLDEKKISEKKGLINEEEFAGGIQETEIKTPPLTEVETPKAEEPEKEVSKEPAAEPAAQLPPKAQAAEEESAGIEKKKVQEPSTAAETEESESLEESESESTPENE